MFTDHCFSIKTLNLLSCLLCDIHVFVLVNHWLEVMHMVFSTMVFLTASTGFKPFKRCSVVAYPAL
jgi:hypothetical protein